MTTTNTQNTFFLVMEGTLTDFYENNRCNKNDEHYFWTMDLVQENTILLRDWNGFELELEEFKNTHDSEDNLHRDRLCKMSSFDTSYTLDPRRFVLQDHGKCGNLLNATRLFRNPTLRKFYLSYLSEAAMEGWFDCVKRENYVRNTMKKVNGTWTAPCTQWEQDLAVFFHLDNVFIWYKNEKSANENEPYHTFLSMKDAWMPYRTTQFCCDLWAFYDRDYIWDRTIYADEEDGGKLKFDEYLNYSEIYSWVKRVIRNVNMMEDALPINVK